MIGLARTVPVRYPLRPENGYLPDIARDRGADHAAHEGAHHQQPVKPDRGGLPRGDRARPRRAGQEARSLADLGRDLRGSHLRGRACAGGAIRRGAGHHRLGGLQELRHDRLAHWLGDHQSGAGRALRQDPGGARLLPIGRLPGRRRGGGARSAGCGRGDAGGISTPPRSGARDPGTGRAAADDSGGGVLRDGRSARRGHPQPRSVAHAPRGGACGGRARLDIWRRGGGDGPHLAGDGGRRPGRGLPAHRPLRGATRRACRLPGLWRSRRKASESPARSAPGESERERTGNDPAHDPGWRQSAARGEDRTRRDRRRSGASGARSEEMAVCRKRSRRQSRAEKPRVPRWPIWSLAPRPRMRPDQPGCGTKRR